jgi:CHAD domain-containing protein/CYTH domain-containing protein
VRHLLNGFNEEAGGGFRRMFDSSDTEALHDFRVGIRRLRSTVRAYRSVLPNAFPPPLRDRLRAIARASGASRDLEVQFAWLEARGRKGSDAERIAADWLRPELIRRAQEAGVSGLAVVRAEFPDARRAVRRALTQRPGNSPDDGELFASVLGKQVIVAGGNLEKRLRRVRTIDDRNQLHRARIAGKRLRYLLEPVAETEAEAAWLVARLKRLQDAIGDMRDAQLFRDRLRAMIEDDSTTNGDAAEAVVVPADVRPGLETLSKRLAEAAGRDFHRMRSRWSEKADTGFLARLRRFANSLLALATITGDNAEIERKYLLRALPPRARLARFIEIDQGWIPGTKLVERLRRSRAGGRNLYYRTIKMGSGIRRTELEERTTRAVFKLMWPLTQGKRISKRRYLVRDAGVLWEIDAFSDGRLVLAEVELDSPKETPAFPAWLRPYVVREVTGDPRYVNRNMAK